MLQLVPRDHGHIQRQQQKTRKRRQKGTWKTGERQAQLPNTLGRFHMAKKLHSPAMELPIDAVCWGPVRVRNCLSTCGLSSSQMNCM